MKELSLEKLQPFGFAESPTPCAKVAVVLERIAPQVPDSLLGGAHGPHDPGLVKDGHDIHAIPVIGLQETGNQVVFHADLPGVDKNTIELVEEGNILQLRATRPAAKVGEGNCRVIYEARILVPGSISPGSTTASYENGVLTITTKKLSPGKPVKIT